MIALHLADLTCYLFFNVLCSIGIIVLLPPFFARIFPGSAFGVSEIAVLLLFVMCLGFPFSSVASFPRLT